MIDLKTAGQDIWNSSYLGGGNICFYPHEEVVRFINKYVRKRKSISQFTNVLNLSREEWKKFASLDLGCGMGRHVKFLDEFGLNPYGIDLSDKSVSLGREWFTAIGKPSLGEKIQAASAAQLPFDDDYFTICISCGVLDSMPREIAKKGIKEAHRVLKNNGLMYIDLIMDTSRGDKDEIVDFGYEKGTIQSYFTQESIKKFIGSEMEILNMKVITWHDGGKEETNRRAHIILRNIK